MTTGEALQVLKSALQSGAGRARLDAETGTTREVAAIAVLAALTTTDITPDLLAIVKQAAADMPLLATGLLALDGEDHLDDLATALTPA